MSQTKNQTMRKTARNVNLQLNSEKTVFEREKLRSLLWLKYSQAFFDFGVEQIFFAMGIEIVFSSTFRFLTGCSIYHSIFCSGKSKRADFFSYVFVCCCYYRLFLSAHFYRMNGCAAIFFFCIVD